jgi:hypothetical protein
MTGATKPPKIAPGGDEAARRRALFRRSELAE